MTKAASNTQLLKSVLITIPASEFGSKLVGVGVNILVKNAKNHAEQLQEVLGVEIIRAEDAFALVAAPNFGEPADEVPITSLFQIHADFTYHANPYLNLLPENEARGIGVELHLFECDPDKAAAKAEKHPDWTVLQAPTDKPHGVRETYLLDGHGYCWVASCPLA